MKLYIASKVQPHVEHWRGLRAVLAELGVDVISSWLDSPINELNAEEPSPDTWRDHWHHCVSESSAADVVLFYAEHGRTQCGALVEVGAALAGGKQVYIVSDYDWSIAHHERCRTFKSLAGALTAIMAWAHCERQRAAA